MNAEPLYAVLPTNWPTDVARQVHKLRWVGKEEDAQIVLEMIQEEWPSVTFTAFKQDVSQNG